MVYQELKRSQVAPKEYVVTLETIETDEHNAPWSHQVNVVWDAGIIPDWDYWLKLYTENDEPHRIGEIIEVDPNHIDEM
jgi:hypothetical protein